MSHKIYFPENGAGGYDVYDVEPAGTETLDGVSFDTVRVTFSDGEVETVPAAHVRECDDVTCIRS